MQPRSLTGIKPTGSPHLGNWLGAIRPALGLVEKYESYYFIADYHALTVNPNSETLREQTYQVAATWLALGLNPEKVVFYRQSDIPEIFELAWILSCFTPKGFMNRAHGYKDRVAKNQEIKADEDDGINMGFYNYPVLMAADILLFSAQVVPVGKDQKQHLEFARDIAERVNNFYNQELLVLPKPIIPDGAETIVGLDGRKMSKSYNNTIPLFLENKPFKKLINKIVTNSQTPEDPKNPNESNVYHIHQYFLGKDEQAKIKQIYQAGGMGWGQAKAMLFETLQEVLEEPRKRYQELMADKAYIDEVLNQGKSKARDTGANLLERVRLAIGVK